jgi:hypothetical protein
VISFPESTETAITRAAAAAAETATGSDACKEKVDNMQMKLPQQNVGAYFQVYTDNPHASRSSSPTDSSVSFFSTTSSSGKYWRAAFKCPRGGCFITCLFIFL